MDEGDAAQYIGTVASNRERTVVSVNLSEGFIRRPIATSLLMAAVAMFGIIAHRMLPISDLPQVDYPTLNVSAGLPGGDPGTMASAVASPLERQFTTISGLDSMTRRVGLVARTSRCSSISIATSTAHPSTCRPPSPGHAVAARRHAGPAILQEEQSGRSADSHADFHVEDVAAAATRRLRGERLPRISMISGVSQVMVQGAAKYAVRVQLIPTSSGAQGLGFDEVGTAVLRTGT